MADMESPSASMQSLNDDVLRKVFMLLPQDDRMRRVPLVCSRWHDLMAAPSMWPVLDVTPWEYGVYRLSRHHDITNMDMWLRRRAAGIRELTLRMQDYDTALLCPIMWAVAEQATQLQQLQIVTRLSDAAVIKSRHLEARYLWPHLRHLDVSYIGTPVGKRQLDRVLSSLPALEFVRLHFRTTEHIGFEYGTDSDSDDAPGTRQLRKLVTHNNFPPNLLRGTRLTYLELGMHDLDTPKNMFSVGGLPEGISALQRLQHLRLDNCMTAPLTQSISHLTQLTCLEITQDELCKWEVYTPHEVMALPASLRVLQAFRVPLNVLAQLTALESLTVEDNAPEATCGLSNLQQLTHLHWCYAKDAGLQIIGACTDLRTLCLRNLDLAETPLTLQCPQLTHLQLCSGEFSMDDVLAMTTELPRLEILEVLEPGGITETEAEGLSRLPKLRSVNLSESLRWQVGHNLEAPSRSFWVPVCECMPLAKAEQLLRLQQAAPHIIWVLEGMGCCDERPPFQRNPVWDWYLAGIVSS